MKLNLTLLKDYPTEFVLEVDELDYDQIWEQIQDQLEPFIELNDIKDCKLGDLSPYLP